jgi:hypothetical protein
MGQTELQPCAWCGDASEGLVELSPPRKSQKAGKEIWIHGQKVPACAVHMAIPREKRVPVPRGPKQAESLF